MAFKTVIVNQLDSCPDCGGTGGVKYHIKTDIPYYIKWGSTNYESKIDAFQKHKLPKTAKCSDCGKRFEFEIITKEPEPCEECGKPRGREEGGSFICPCPHCGDEIPF